MEIVELKDIVSGMKNSFPGLNSELGKTEKGCREFEDRSM